MLSVLLLTTLPALAQQPTLRAAPGEEAAGLGFSRAVALNGEEAIVGEPFNVLSPGAVYVFEYEESTRQWVERQRLTASDATLADGFGRAVALADDVLLVGADQQDNNLGAAYIFRKDPASGQWVEEAKLATRAAVPSFRMGGAVALHGSLALVGAYLENDETGAAYLFAYEASSGTWSEQGRLTPDDGAPGDRFGFALGLTDGEALVGAYRHNQDIGAAYVFQHDAATDTWPQVDKLAGTDTQAGAQFGFALSLNGEEALIGAPWYNGFEGAVYVFRKDNTGVWQEAQQLTGTGLQSGDRFGYALAVYEDQLWSGAPFSGLFSGAVYTFDREEAASPWVEQERLTSSPSIDFGTFGRTVTLGASFALAGAGGEDFSAGAAYVFEQRDGSGSWVQQARIISSDAVPEAITGTAVACVDGQAALFPCGNIDLLAFLPTQQIGGARGAGTNDLWGWTDPDTGREYALVGRIDGVGFVDVTDPVNPVYLGNLPTHTESSTWRDVKVYANHAFVVADGAGAHGVQIFDLTQLRTPQTPPPTYAATARYDQIDSAHNIAINTETGFAYVVGASGGGATCGGGLHMVNIQNPANPTFAGCFTDGATGRGGTGYSHDVQCVVYRGPDADYEGKEICFGSNETALSISDVTDKTAPVSLAIGTYPSASYTHQGWLTDDHRYFFLDDELDELNGLGLTRTLIWDVTDLDDPSLMLEFQGTTPATDHNQYVDDDYVFQSNYAGGLRILDINDPSAPREVAYFDVFPAHDANGFSGSWSNYPFFASGNILVTGREAGLFIVRPTTVPVHTEQHEVPGAFVLAPAYPNPFNPTTTLTLTLNQAQQVTVRAFDVLGREVAVLHRGSLAAGVYPLPFDASALPSGTYLVRAEGANATRTQVVLLAK